MRAGKAMHIGKPEGLGECQLRLPSTCLMQVSEEKWRLSVQNGPEYKLCPTYPQLMYVPRGIQVCMYVCTGGCMFVL